MNITIDTKVRKSLSPNELAMIFILFESSENNEVRMTNDKMCELLGLSLSTVQSVKRSLLEKRLVSKKDSSKLVKGSVFVPNTYIIKSGVMEFACQKQEIGDRDATGVQDAMLLNFISNIEKCEVAIGGKIYNVWNEFVKSQEAQILENEEKIKVAKRNIDLLNSTRKNLLDLK